MESGGPAPRAKASLFRIAFSHRRSGFVGLLTFALLAGLANRAFAAESAQYSGYEQAVVEAKLRELGAEEDPVPDGKRIAEIRIVSLDVFDASDPVPDFFNVFHMTTRERVIRRTLLFGEGEVLDSRRLDETARSLRTLRQLSLVLMIPLKHQDPRQVRILVITKDVWSLRLNSNFDIGSEGVTYLLLNPSEENLFGTHASVGALFVLQRSTYSVGGQLSHNRILGTRLAGAASASIVFNRDTGRSEGSFGGFSYGLPQYSESQRWIYGAAIGWDDGIRRVSVRPRSGPTTVLSYHRELYLAGYELTRSFGTRRKFDVTLGMEADRRAYVSRAPAGIDPALRRTFESQEIPVSDTRIGPYLQFEQYQNEFLKTIELETLGLQEDFRLGPRTLLKVYPASEELGSSRTFLAAVSGLSYTFRLGDGLVRAVALHAIEYATRARHQAQLSAGLRFASPRLGFGRFILDGALDHRYRNYLRRQVALGGDGRLRGYPSGTAEAAGSAALRGPNAVVMNAEFRTAGIDILSAQCGLAAFYDMGDAGERLQSLTVKRSLGLGLRMVFPQANRVAFRADWAVALDSGTTALPGTLFVTFEQAFLMPDLAAPNVTSALLD